MGGTAVGEGVNKNRLGEVKVNNGGVNKQEVNMGW